ncbi:MAG: serine hydrolase domain-containing protein [Pseudomonadota bacterium]
MTSALHAKLDAVIERAVASGQIVGTVVLIGRKGREVYRKAAGWADREAARPMQEDAIFRLASLTKPVTSIALMSLVEEGRVALDDPVTRYLPDFRPKLPDGTEPDITLAQLLTHTSGLQYRGTTLSGPYHDLGVSDGLDQPGLGLEENLARLAQAPLNFVPGATWRYSISLDVLGAVIAAATGMSFPEAVKARVTDTLGLKDTGFSVTDESRLVAPYVKASPVPQPMRDPETITFRDGQLVFAPSRILNPASFPSGGGGMAGTAPEAYRLFSAIAGGGSPILSQESVAEMARPHIPAGTGGLGPGLAFGYGWSVVMDPKTVRTPQSPGTLAWGGVYGHHWFIDPKLGWVAVILTNVALEGMDGAYMSVIRNAVYSAGAH